MDFLKEMLFPYFENDFVKQEVLQEGPNYRIIRYKKLECNISGTESNPHIISQLKI